MAATPTPPSPKSRTEVNVELNGKSPRSADKASTETGTEKNSVSITEAENRKDSIPEVDLTKDTPATTSNEEQGTKRTHEESTSAPGVDDPEVYLGQLPVTDSCQVVRNKINRLIESGEMKVGDFCTAIGVSSNAYYNFMHKHGTMKGAECAAYPNAAAFFQKREEAGLKLPTKKQKTAKDDGKGGKDGKAEAEKLDIDDVELYGEETDSVPVYDTCDDIRRQITAYLKKPGVTQAQFGRDLLKQFHTDRAPKGISGSQMQAFRGKKGPDAGNTSSVFYGAYVVLREDAYQAKQAQEREEKGDGGSLGSRRLRH